MPDKSLASILRGIPAVAALIDTAIAGLSLTLIRDRLIPDQLDIIGAVGSLFVLLSFLATWAYQSGLRKYLRICIVVSFVALITLVILQVKFVISVPGIGSPPTAHHFLVGFQLTEQGISWRKPIGHKSEAEYIKDIGPDRIPDMYGWSYTIIAILYVAAYLLFVIGVGLITGAASIGEGTAEPGGS